MTTYRTIIAGSRTITDYDTVVDAIESAPFDISTVISGTASGVDTLGEKWADAHNTPIDRFPPSKYEEESAEAGMPAPIYRNRVMATEANAEALIAVWNGRSNGTEHMIDCAERAELEIHCVRTDSRCLDDFLAEGEGAKPPSSRSGAKPSE